MQIYKRKTKPRTIYSFRKGDIYKCILHCFIFVYSNNRYTFAYCNHLEFSYSTNPKIYLVIKWLTIKEG